MKLISVDDHVFEHPRVWLDRLPHGLQDRGPRIVETDDGSERWLLEGELVSHLEVNMGLSASAGLDWHERSFEPLRFDQMLPGTYDPVARLKDMDEDGVWAQTCFPTFARFAGVRFLTMKDKALALLCVKAYNDFILDEWCAAAPHRYIPLIILPLWDVDLSALEIERCGPRGARAITFPDATFPIGLPSIYTGEWDRVFSAAAEHELVLCMHFGSSGLEPAVDPLAPQAVTTSLFGITLYSTMATWVMSPVFHRHPTLKIAFSEGGIGWWPFALMRMDTVWEHYRFYNLERQIDKETRPSDVVRSNVYGCFIDDPLGVKLRHDIGVRNIMWESDYPHADSLWPKSRENAQRVFADVPDQEVRQIVETNARRVFRFP
jgi:predicted TIM-barrel fold metal-dependent hydrolase